MATSAIYTSYFGGRNLNFHPFTPSSLHAFMRILVTGGAGYIGSHAVRILNQAGHDVWTYDNLGLGHRDAVPQDKLIVGDLLDKPRLEAALKEQKIEAVMHFAPFAAVGESVVEPAKYYQNNIVGSLS